MDGYGERGEGGKRRRNTTSVQIGLAFDAADADAGGRRVQYFLQHK